MVTIFEASAFPVTAMIMIAIVMRPMMTQYMARIEDD